MNWIPIQLRNCRLPRYCMLLGLFLLICGAKLWLIDRFGNATPFWDEWDTEAKIIKASVEGTFSPMQLLENRNEHRIAFTQTLVLLLFRADKQWDPILQMVAQAPLYALAIVAFVAMAGKYMGNLQTTALAGFAACLGILPFGWKSTLWGITSCFYFLILFGIAVIWMCWRYEIFTWRWWIGALFAVAVLFTMAGGVFSIVAVTAFLAARLIFERGKEWKRFAGAATLAAIVAVGVANTPLHAVDTYMAGSFRAFLWAFTGILAWPCEWHWACIIIQAPLIALALVSVYRRVPFNDGRWFVIIAGAAYWMQALAVAYKRCGLWDASKYTDFWGMLLIIICACLCFLRGCLDERRRFLIYPIAAVWLSVCIFGMLERTVSLLPRQIMDFRSDLFEEENNAREYLATGNSTWLKGKIPFETPEMMRQMLGSDSIRRVLPANLIDPTPPLSPFKQKSGGGEFVQNGFPNSVPPLNKMVFGSYGNGRVKSKGGITLEFKVPRGTQQVDLQIAGYPNARGVALKVEEPHGASYSIAPPLDPGDNWQTISVGLNPKSTSFKISAKDQSDGAWLAFSMPVASNGHAPGRWARLLAANSICFLDLGFVLLVLGALSGIASAEPGGVQDKL